MNSRRRLPIKRDVAIAGASRKRSIAIAPAPTSSVDARSPNGTSRAPTCTLNGAWNGLVAGRSRRSRTRAAIFRASVATMATAYACASQPTRPPLTNMTRMVAATATSMARDGVPNLVCRNVNRCRQRAFDRQPLEQLLGVAQCEVRGRHQQEHRGSDQRDRHDIPRPPRSRKMLCQSRQRSVRPERLLAGGHEQDEQKRTGHRRENREQGDEEARPLQRLEAGRPQFVRRACHGVTPADGREGQREAEQVDQRDVEWVPARRRSPAAAATRVPSTRTGPRIRLTRPQTVTRVRMPTAIHTPRAIRSDVRSNPIRARSHRRPDQQHRNERREVFRPHVTRQTPSRDRRQRDGRGVLADDDAGKRREHEPFDQTSRGRGLGCSGAERLMDAGHGAAGNEQRPALDVDGADEGAHDRGREHEPGGAISERRSSGSGDEERRNARAARQPARPPSAPT